MASGKRKRDGPPYHPGYIPQQDGASDSLSYESKVDFSSIHYFSLFNREKCRLP